MCGIAGIYTPSESIPIDKDLLAAMNRSLTHRGPDDEGFLFDGRVGLAMRRLKIIDLAGGHQPLSNEDGTVWVVFNGEIYNYRKLRRCLQDAGHRFKTQSDTEVLVHAYEEHGEDFVDKLHGMFAFALWDKKNRKLVLGRDPFGIKPLFTYFHNGLFLFASEIKAILAHPAVSKDIDWQALSDFLSFLYIPAPKTIFQHIRKLEPGRCLALQDGILRTRQYWDLRPGGPGGEKSEQEYRAELTALGRKAVQSHLMSDVPVGAFLSGGVDSSIVAALAVRETGPGLHTFSVGFDAARYDELSYARQVANHLGTNHHELHLASNAMQALPAVVACFDEPFGDSSAIPTYHLSKFARERVTVALAGDGGDELFAGYEWMRRQRWVDVMKRSVPHASRFLKRWLEKSVDSYPVKDGSLAAFVRFLDDGDRPAEQAFYRRSTCLSASSKDALLSGEIKQALGGYDSYGVFERAFSGTSADPYDRMLAWDSKVFLPDDDLCKVDRMSMAHSLEVRVPVLDRSLVEWSAGVPFALKLRGMQTKYIWKSAFRDMLPPAVFKQRKQGFSVPLRQWLHPYLPQIRRMLLGKDSFCSGIFNVAQMRRMLDLQETGGYRLAGPVYLMLVLEIWARAALKKETPAESTTLQEFVA